MAAQTSSGGRRYTAERAATCPLGRRAPIRATRTTKRTRMTRPLGPHPVRPLYPARRWGRRRAPPAAVDLVPGDAMISRSRPAPGWAMGEIHMATLPEDSDPTLDDSSQEHADREGSGISPEAPTRIGPGGLLEESRTIGSYRLMRRVGTGGMGEVYLAEQTPPVRRQGA